MTDGPASNLAEFTVSELSFAIKRTMEDSFGLVRLRGEISGYRGPHSSGHAYLCLKDERAKIDGVIWKGTLSGLKFKPEEGLEVIVTGRITTYPNKSSYQIVIEKLEPAGAGALMALLEERKRRLAAEGLFDQSKKKALPFWPQVVGVITSPTGAVIRDILHGFSERCPVRVCIWPVRVQGETCGAEVAAAIRGFNAAGGAIPRPDVIIVARGGGSLEDLWGFNDEAVVRAAADSVIPIVSAVGHETDWTLIDLAADARAPTPTKAAEWVVPKHADLVVRLDEAMQRKRRCLLRHLENKRTNLRGIERGLPRPQSLLALPRQHLDATGFRLSRAIHGFALHARNRLEKTAPRLSVQVMLHRTAKFRDRLSALETRSDEMFRRLLRGKERRFDVASSRFAPSLVRHPMVRKRGNVEAIASRLPRAFANIVTAKRVAVRARSELLTSLGHQRVLERGFALIRDADAKIVTRRKKLAATTGALEIEFADGAVSVNYDIGGYDVRTVERPRAAAAKNRVPSKSSGSQGTLL